ncbi:AraC family transcriptional regulator [Rhizosphaericola mali]|uniref:Helix-turn-helix domain-containing protein n=1 Tax=Rhizosphaericola mali TaxID=2545455 RepID=A0A5P2G0Y7_9BACT|nr:helix-turn-helix domain-containing protein [Rhizosphaericola mali]QES88328.1 helix-turn-helix domain-containing protein [Rhizosphaericola mali]
MKEKFNKIPQYSITNFRHVHRLTYTSSSFGNNIPDKTRLVEGFEIYSGEGMVHTKGPLKSNFYRMGITVNGSLDMGIGLNKYNHQPGTLSFTFPNQVFSTYNVSDDITGYYLFFSDTFLSDIIPSVKIVDEFPFFYISGTAAFQITNEELEKILVIVNNINLELDQHQTGRDTAIKMYLYLMLLEAKRSYERQKLEDNEYCSYDNYKLFNRFIKLVNEYFLTKRLVKEYAQMLGVGANHLNRIVKENMGITASKAIKEMILQEAKSLLKYTDNSVAEIAYQLDFSDPTSFNRFFKDGTNETPLVYRSKNT